MPLGIALWAARPTCQYCLPHALLGDVTMGLPIRCEGSLKDKTTDLVLPLKLGLPFFQLLWSEVRLNVSDLDVSMLLVETCNVHLCTTCRLQIINSSQNH